MYVIVIFSVRSALSLAREKIDWNFFLLLFSRFFFVTQDSLFIFQSSQGEIKVEIKVAVLRSDIC
jgi:hypothetical protein